MPCRLRQHGRDEVFLLQEPLAFEQEKEKGLVLLDRPADAAAELILIGIAFISAHQIIEPALRLKRRVVVRVEQCAVKLVTARAGLQADLSRALTQ